MTAIITALIVMLFERFINGKKIKASLSCDI